MAEGNTHSGDCPERVAFDLAKVIAEHEGINNEHDEESARVYWLRLMAKCRTVVERGDSAETAMNT